MRAVDRHAFLFYCRNNFLKYRGFVFSDVGKYLSVEHYILFLQKINEAAITQTFCTYCGAE